MNQIISVSIVLRVFRLLAASAFVFSSCLLQAQDFVPPTLVSASPPDGATGVSVSTPVVFVFSERMDPDATGATFITTNFPPQILEPDYSWSADGTRLTCTISDGWPNNAGIQWFVSGADVAGNELLAFPLPLGKFFTGGGGSVGGSGTNAVTTFQLGVTHQYVQTSAAAPVLDPDIGYLFNAITTLSSNRTATNVTLTLPTSAVQTLTRTPSAAEQFVFFAQSTNAATFNPSFNGGNYTFAVRSTDSNQTVTVNLPANGQPNAPHIANFAAAQAVDANQSFTLNWDAFVGGITSGSVSNFITVEVEGDYPDPTLGDAEYLPRTATSVVIPAGRLKPQTTYEASVAFWTGIWNTNSPAANTLVWRVTRTVFPLVTTGGGGSPLVLTNWVSLPGGAIQFEVVTGAGQNLAVERADTVTAQNWATVLTTNAVTGRITYRETPPVGATSRFYRARRLN